MSMDAINKRSYMVFVLYPHCLLCLSKVAFIYCHPPHLRSATPGLCDSLNCLQSLPQPIALMSIVAGVVSGKLCLFT